MSSFKLVWPRTLSPQQTAFTDCVESPPRSDLNGRLSPIVEERSLSDEDLCQVEGAMPRVKSYSILEEEYPSDEEVHRSNFLCTPSKGLSINPQPKPQLVESREEQAESYPRYGVNGREATKGKNSQIQSREWESSERSRAAKSEQIPSQIVATRPIKRWYSAVQAQSFDNTGEASLHLVPSVKPSSKSSFRPANSRAVQVTNTEALPKADNKRARKLGDISNESSLTTKAVERTEDELFKSKNQLQSWLSNKRNSPPELVPHGSKDDMEDSSAIQSLSSKSSKRSSLMSSFGSRSFRSKDSPPIKSPVEARRKISRGRQTPLSPHTEAKRTFFHSSSSSRSIQSNKKGKEVVKASPAVRQKAVPGPTRDDFFNRYAVKVTEVYESGTPGRRAPEVMREKARLRSVEEVENASSSLDATPAYEKSTPMASTTEELVVNSLLADMDALYLFEGSCQRNLILSPGHQNVDASNSKIEEEAPLNGTDEGQFIMDPLSLFRESFERTSSLIKWEVAPVTPTDTQADDLCMQVRTEGMEAPTSMATKDKPSVEPKEEKPPEIPTTFRAEKNHSPSEAGRLSRLRRSLHLTTAILKRDYETPAFPSKEPEIFKATIQESAKERAPPTDGGTTTDESELESDADDGNSKHYLGQSLQNSTSLAKWDLSMARNKCLNDVWMNETETEEESTDVEPGPAARSKTGLKRSVRFQDDAPESSDDEMALLEREPEDFSLMYELKEVYFDFVSCVHDAATVEKSP